NARGRGFGLPDSSWRSHHLRLDSVGHRSIHCHPLFPGSACPELVVLQGTGATPVYFGNKICSMDSELARQIIEAQRSLIAKLMTPEFPQLLITALADLMNVKNLLLIAFDGRIPGPWVEKTPDWSLKSYSL